MGSECDHLPEAGNNNYLGSECDHLPEAGNTYIGTHPSACNNRPFSSASEYQTAAAESATLNNIANTALQHKLSRYVDTSMSLVQNGIYGTGNTLMTVTNLASEFRPYHEEKTGTGGKIYGLV